MLSVHFGGAGSPKSARPTFGFLPYTLGLSCSGVSGSLRKSASGGGDYLHLKVCLERQVVGTQESLSPVRKGMERPPSNPPFIYDS